MIMRHCEYTKPNGTFCGSPALRGRDYCHWYLTFVAGRLRMQKQAATCDPTPVELPPLEDANSIQLAIMTVMDAILHDRVGPKKGNQLLYGLQLASNNLKQGVNFQPKTQAEADDQQEQQHTVLCSSYDSLEADYDIQEHSEQLKASATNQRIDAAKEAEEKQENEHEEEEQLSEQEQYLRWVRELDGIGFPRNFGPEHPEFGLYFANWKKHKQQEEEKHQRYWRCIRQKLIDVAHSGNEELLRVTLAFFYHDLGLHYESDGWKPASAQKVLFPRKPPESVQQQWHERRHANCSAEIDQTIADQEAARKKTS
jgi:hypothetical protein